MWKRIFPLAGILLGALFQVSPVPLRAFALQASGLERVSVPAQVNSISPITSADFNGDGSLEIVSLQAETVSILSGEELLWQSPPAWRVLQGQVTDLNHDGRPEFTLLVWRPFQPWPVDRWLPNGGRIADFHDADGQSCHIILIGWMSDGYREVWAGSALAEPVSFFTAADFNGDGRQEIATLEGSYASPRSVVSHQLKIWEWNGFGFTVLSEINGSFDKLVSIKTADGRILLFVP